MNGWMGGLPCSACAFCTLHVTVPLHCSDWISLRLCLPAMKGICASQFMLSWYCRIIYCNLTSCPAMHLMLHSTMFSAMQQSCAYKHCMLQQLSSISALPCSPSTSLISYLNRLQVVSCAQQRVANIDDETTLNSG